MDNKKEKKGIRNKVIWTIIVIATIYVVYASVNIGMQLAKKVSDSEKTTTQKKSLNKKEETKDFVINYKEETSKLENLDKVEVVENRRTVPIITSSKYQESADKIVKFLTDISNNKWNDIKSASDEYTSLNLSDKVGVDIILSNIYQDDNYISFKFTINGNLGKVSLDDIETYNFDIKTGELLSIEDIVLDQNGLTQVVYDKISKELKENKNAEDLDTGWEDRLKREMFYSGNWYLNEKGINFNFSKYTFGPGYLGIIESTIEYNNINNYLKENYRKNS